MTYNLSHAQLANAVYKFSPELPAGWTLLEKYDHPETGYQGGLYQKTVKTGNTETIEYAFVSRGTEPTVSDAAADYLMGMGKVPAQFNEAKEFLRRAQRLVTEANGDPAKIS